MMAKRKVKKSKKSEKPVKSNDKVVDVSKMKDVDLQKILEDMNRELAKTVVGQKEIVHGIMRAILCNGHVLVEGVPGVAKTVIVKSIATILDCDMKRVQFTVDLLPTDITGIMSYTPEKGFEIVKGPVFTNFLLADEINRSPPKTQSALLEAMQEKEVTIARETHKLPVPFFVMATENPLEVSGVYTLPEAQVDRFLFKLLIGYPKSDEERLILSRNTTIKTFEEYGLKPVISIEQILKLQDQVKKVFTSEAIEEYIVKIVTETRSKTMEFSNYISYGASPRASIAMYIASKAEALMCGRDYVTPKDVQIVSYPVLRHRIILNYEAEAEKVTTDKIIKHIISKVSVP